MPSNDLFWLIVFDGIVALAVLIQAGVLLGIFLTVRKAVNVGKEEADAYRAKLTPIIESGSQLISTGKDLVAATETFVKNIQPEFQSAARELANMTHDIHAQINYLQASVDEVALKARHQADRVDGMTTSLLNGLDRFGSFVNEAVHVPIRQVNGVVAAAKAVVDTLRTPTPARPRPRPAREALPVSDDKDLFV